MSTININIDDPLMETWEDLPAKSREAITSKTLNAFLNGTLYPTGTDQIELAMELAEAGVNADTISKLTRLEKEVFIDFIKQ